MDVTVIDDETASTTVTLSVHPASVAEEVSAREITVTGTLDQAPRAQATAVTVSVAGDTATAAADFAAVPDFELTIEAECGERDGDVHAGAGERRRGRGRRDGDGKRFGGGRSGRT